MTEQLVHVTGLSDLQAFMDQLAPKFERNLLRGALRAGARVMLPIARGRIHRISGRLAKSLYVTTSTRGGTVTAALKSKDFRARWVEYGTKPHTITAKGRKALSLGGVFFQSVDHPGARPRSFMRSTLDTEATRAVVAAAEHMKAKLDTKYGLDTSDVSIGVEES